jgi:hypothetical protein
VIKAVKQRDGLAPRVHYNLACYHARRAAQAIAAQNPEQADREAAEALDALERFAWVAEPDEMVRTLEWALDDPALKSVRRGLEHRLRFSRPLAHYQGGQHASRKRRLASPSTRDPHETNGGAGASRRRATAPTAPAAG